MSKQGQGEVSSDTVAASEVVSLDVSALLHCTLAPHQCPAPAHHARLNMASADNPTSPSRRRQYKDTLRPHIRTIQSPAISLTKW